MASDGPVKPKREQLTVLGARVAVWQYDVLWQRARERGVSIGEVLRAVLDEALTSQRTR